MSLPRVYKKVAFSPVKALALNKTPVRVSVNPGRSKEQYQLQGLKLEDLPRRTDMVKVLNMMKNPEDWRNLSPFLTGLVSSERPLRPEMYSKIVRLSGESGVPGIALAAAKQVSRTGLTLGNAEIARDLFHAFRLQAQKAGFKGEAVESALRGAQDAAYLLNDPKHKALNCDEDPQRLPEIIGVLLELSAARALDSYGGKDKTGEVANYVRSLHVNWQFGDYTPPSGWRDANFKIRDWVSTWHGLKMALEVEEIAANRKMTAHIRSQMILLGPIIEKATADVIAQGGSEKRVGVSMSKLLYDAKIQNKILQARE